jgi:hypothetical protein
MPQGRLWRRSHRSWSYDRIWAAPGWNIKHATRGSQRSTAVGRAAHAVLEHLWFNLDDTFGALRIFVQSESSAQGVVKYINARPHLPQNAYSSSASVSIQVQQT